MEGRGTKNRSYLASSRAFLALSGGARSRWSVEGSTCEPEFCLVFPGPLGPSVLLILPLDSMEAELNAVGGRTCRI